MLPIRIRMGIPFSPLNLLWFVEGSNPMMFLHNNDSVIPAHVILGTGFCLRGGVFISDTWEKDVVHAPSQTAQPL